MKKITLTMLAVILTAGYSFLQAQSQEDAQKWMDYMTPASMQQMMAKWDGDWNEEIKMWQTPGAPEQTMQATCTNKMILGGRYQEAKHEGNFMGMPFEGIGITGWDNARKIFVSSWIDNFGTGMMYMEGSWDADKKAMILKGKMTDPITGKQVDVRQVMTIIDDDTQLMEQYSMFQGKEFKSMEIKLSRKK
ncbi:MAG: DUF1579 domain-containing protein [Bacteroidetes bacterium]|nr:DUF1579 domain-containing protein [Bacteroidota bacterium]